MCETLKKQELIVDLPRGRTAISIVQCARCGEILAAGEGFYRIHGFPYCEYCLDAVDAEELIRICEIPKRIWLTNMGFCYERVSDGEGV